MQKKIRRLKIIIGLLILTGLSVAAFAIFYTHKNYKTAVFIWNNESKTFRQEEKMIAAGSSERNNEYLSNIGEKYILSGGKLTVYSNDKVIWQSPEDWTVDSFAVSDITGKGEDELGLSVWKAGDFGKEKPFWVKENDQSIKNHFFVYRIENGDLKPIWQSSNLDKPNCEFVIAGADYDGKNELVVIEGDYSWGISCKGEYLAVWRWNGWGFTNFWRSNKGSYKNLRRDIVDGKISIAVDADSTY